MDEWITKNFLTAVVVVGALIGFAALCMEVGRGEGFREGFRDGIGYCVPTPAKE